MKEKLRTQKAEAELLNLMEKEDRKKSELKELDYIEDLIETKKQTEQNIIELDDSLQARLNLLREAVKGTKPPVCESRTYTEKAEKAKDKPVDQIQGTTIAEDKPVGLLQDTTIADRAKTVAGCSFLLVVFAVLCMISFVVVQYINIWQHKQQEPPITVRPETETLEEFVSRESQVLSADERQKLIAVTESVLSGQYSMSYEIREAFRDKRLKAGIDSPAFKTFSEHFVDKVTEMKIEDSVELMREVYQELLDGLKSAKSYIDFSSEPEKPAGNITVKTVPIVQTTPITVSAEGGTFTLEPQSRSDGEVYGYKVKLPLDHPLMVGASTQYINGQKHDGKIVFFIANQSKVVTVSEDGKILSYFDPVHNTAFRDEITQVKNECYTGDQYHVKQNNQIIQGKNLRTRETFVIDLDHLLRESTVGKSELLDLIFKLPGEVLHDVSISVNSIIHKLDEEKIYGEQSSNGGCYQPYSKTVVTGSSMSIFCHEIGHAVHYHNNNYKDLNITYQIGDEAPPGYDIWQPFSIKSDASNTGLAFYKAFKVEQDAYEKNRTGYVHHMQNPTEMFAYLYEIVMNTDKGYVNGYAYAGDEAQQATLKAFKEYLKDIRRLPIKDRNTEFLWEGRQADAFASEPELPVIQKQQVVDNPTTTGTTAKRPVPVLERRHASPPQSPCRRRGTF